MNWMLSGSVTGTGLRALAGGRPPVHSTKAVLHPLVRSLLLRDRGASRRRAKQKRVRPVQGRLEARRERRCQRGGAFASVQASASLGRVNSRVADIGARSINPPSSFLGVHVSERPREHVVEEESNRALVAALPSTWVARPQDPDYGIDYTVEIFEDGSRTGLFFNVQIKATDEAKLDKALRSVRFSRPLADYYAAQASPVLVVRYHAPTGQLYWKWFDAYDPHLRPRSTASPEAGQSIGFRFDESDAWSETTPDQLVAGVRGFRRFHQAEQRLPLTLLVEDTAAVDPHELAVALRGSLRAVRDLITVERRAATPEDAVVEVREDRARVSLADVASATIHVEPSLRSTGWLAPNLAVALALTLTNIGQTNIAAQLTATCGDQADLLTDPECCLVLAGAFFRSRRVPEALRLLDRLDASGQWPRELASYLLMSALLARGSNLTTEERELAEQVVGARLQRRIDRRDLPSAASEAYNLAMLYKRTLQLEKAQAAFERAAELDPTYLGRGYYHADLAGALFGQQHYATAAEHYSRAIELGAEPYVEALAADALIYAGRYREAIDLLTPYLEPVGEASPEDAEWRLKKAVIPLLIDVGGESQDREPDTAAAEIEPVDFQNSQISISEALTHVDRALSKDACCAEAWFRRALLQLAIRGELADGRDAALTAAVIGGNGLAAWANSIRFADQSDETCLLDQLRTAYKFVGSDIEPQILEIARTGVGVDEARMRELLEEAVRDVDHATVATGFVMRIPGSSGTMEELRFSPPTDRKPEGNANVERDSGPSSVSGDLGREVPDAGVELLAELRRRLGDEWFAEAGTMRFEVTEGGDVVLHTGKWTSFMWGKEESAGMILAVNRAQSQAQISIVAESGRFEHLGPIDGDF